MKENLKQVRVFSEAVRKKAVKDIETGKASVSKVCREFDVSHTSVYRWLNKYSRHLQSGKKLVLQMDSEAYKSKELEKRIQELEAALGRKQLEVDFLNRLIDQGKEELGVDLKKKSFTPPSGGSKETKDSTDTK
jgi:transposase-like protein